MLIGSMIQMRQNPPGYVFSYLEVM